MVDLLVFELANQRFGLPLRDVQEVVRAVLPAPLPGAPPLVEGLIDVRGALAPVLDVRRRFGLAPRALDADQHFVLVRTSAGDRPPRLVALRVDRAADLARVEEAGPDELERAGPGSPHVAGVARLPDGLILIHDVARFLSAAEAEALDEAMREHGREQPGSHAREDQ